MEKDEIKIDGQLLLFRTIQTVLPRNLSLVHEVADTLDISTNAAYCRIRGDKRLYFEEAIRLCHRFQISLDSFIGATNQKQIQCFYTPLGMSSPIRYDAHIQESASIFECIASTPGNEMFILTGADITAFNIFAFTELAMFRYFSWCNLFGCAASYETFVEAAATDEILKCYGKIVRDYMRMPSSEIWTVNTTDTVLRFLNYHYEMGHFSDVGNVLFLCRKLTELMDTLEEWATTGTKGVNGVMFRLYISEIDIGNTFILFKNAERLHCWLKLFTMHGLAVANEEFCGEVENWINQSLQRATLISGASAIERYKYFDSQRQKIEMLVKKIQMC